MDFEKEATGVNNMEKMRKTLYTKSEEVGIVNAFAETINDVVKLVEQTKSRDIVKMVESGKKKEVEQVINNVFGSLDDYLWLLSFATDVAMGHTEALTMALNVMVKDKEESEIGNMLEEMAEHYGEE